MAQPPETTSASNNPTPSTGEPQRHWSRHLWLGAVGFLLTGTVVAYVLARYASVDTGMGLGVLLFLAGVGLLTFVAALSIRSLGPLPSTIASLFAVSILALPLFGFAAVQGLANRAENAVGDFMGELEGDLGEISDDTTGSGNAFGDDPEMDALWTSCEEGDMEACDDLYFTAPLGSEYEAFGATCGNRENTEMSGTCAFRD